jgi:hypothetical protein
MIKKIGLSIVLISTLVVSANAQTYSQKDMDKVLKRLDALESAKASTEESIDELYDRADENEFQATMNRIKWGAEFEVSDNFFDGKSGSMPEYNKAGSEYSNSNQLTMKLRLSMDAKVNEKTKFTGRLSMYKNWSDSIGGELADPAQGRKPVGDSSIYVERAYVDYSPIESFTITLGRQPSSDGPGMTLIENTKRKSTYPALLFDGAADGVVLTYKLASKSKMNPIIRAAYGKGFQNHINYAPYEAKENELDDLNVYGAFYEMSLPITSMGENLLVLSYVMGTDFIGHPQQPNAIVIGPNKNLGDMALAGIYFENNKAFGTNLNDFISAGWNMPDSNGNKVILKDSTGADMPPMELIKENGNAFQIGARYDFDSGIKIGYEYNHGSKYWYSFTNGSSDLLNKLATRGSVNDFYALYQLDLNQFVKIGYTMIDYDYTGSGWHIGQPVKTDDYTNRAYATYNLRF